MEKTEPRRSDARWRDLYHYRIAYEDGNGARRTLLLETNDKLGVGSLVEQQGQLIQIAAVEANPYRGVVTPLRGYLR